MINLLPQDTKEDISYARRNNGLIRWIVFSGLALVGVGVIVVGGLLYMQQSINNYSKQVADARLNLQAQKVDETQKHLEDISASTKLTVQVLSREILFSKLLRQIGSALPNNTALKTLQIDKLQGGVQLNAAAADFNAATQLQLNLQDKQNGVFEKADINSITCTAPGSAPSTTAAGSASATSAAATNSDLPCDVNLRALFSKNNTYVYIAPTTNPGGAKP